MSPFSAGPEEEVNANWESLLDGACLLSKKPLLLTASTVAVIKLSPEEASRLPAPTDPLYGDPGFFAGNVEVIHQLHCLVSLFQNPSSIDADLAS